MQRNPDVDFLRLLADGHPDGLARDPRRRGRAVPFGGAIALGHPFGMTGARIMTTLLNGLRARNGDYGIESMCVAGGMGQAMLVEMLESLTANCAARARSRTARSRR